RGGDRHPARHSGIGPPHALALAWVTARTHRASTAWPTGRQRRHLRALRNFALQRTMRNPRRFRLFPDDLASDGGKEASMAKAGPTTPGPEEQLGRAGPPEGSDKANVLIRPPMALALAAAGGLAAAWLYPLSLLPAFIPAGWVGPPCLPSASRSRSGRWRPCAAQERGSRRINRRRGS